MNMGRKIARENKYGQKDSKREINTYGQKDSKKVINMGRKTARHI